jgi:hypothetical protein
LHTDTEREREREREIGREVGLVQFLTHWVLKFTYVLCTDREGGKKGEEICWLDLASSIMKYIPLLIDYGRILCG